VKQTNLKAQSADKETELKSESTTKKEKDGSRSI
jgi:hypothetical protein